MQAETFETSETEPLKGISEATAAEILAFRDDRQWLPYHNPKDLAMSVAIEAGELLEVFQWSGTDLERGERRGELADELADVLIYAAMLADRAGLSMDEIVRAKLVKSAARYPVDKVKGSGARPTIAAGPKPERRAAESPAGLRDAADERAHDHQENEGPSQILAALRHGGEGHEEADHDAGGADETKGAPRLLA